MKVNIEITLSKILSYIVLVVGSVYSYIFQDASVLIATFSAASAIISIKTYMSSKERQKKIEYNEEIEI